MTTSQPTTEIPHQDTPSSWPLHSTREQHGSLLFFTPGLQGCTLPSLSQLVATDGQLAALEFPGLPANISCAGYQHSPSLAVPALQLELRLPGPRSKAFDTYCQFQEPRCHNSCTSPRLFLHIADRLLVAAPALAAKLVRILQTQHAAQCRRLASAALFAVRQSDLAELETEAAGGGTGSDGCGEDGGEGGGASW